MGGFALLSCSDAVIKTMSGSWSPAAVAALRFAIGAAGLHILLLLAEGSASLRPRNRRLQFIRGGCLGLASVLFFSAIFVMPLVDAIALAFVSPVFTALLSGPFLNEKVRPNVWLSSGIALVGVAIVLRPNLATLGGASVLPLASAFFFSLMTIANRASVGQGSALAMQAHIAFWALPVLLVAAVLGHLSGEPSFQVDPPDWTIVARCGVVALIASTAHWLIYLGTTRAGAATIAPVVYVQVLVAGVIGWWWFGNVPDLATFAGMAIIIAAGLLLWSRPGPSPGAGAG
jgi:drug/metabolite transporter (DMT)-like permease